MPAPKEWMSPDEWQKLVDGTACPICQVSGGEAANEFDFYVARLPLSTVRLSRNQRAPGYTLVYCSRHVTEPHELSAEGRRDFFEDVVAVGEALQRIYRPLKLNFQMLGNTVPHLHCHVIPRDRGDAAPHAPPGPVFDLPPVELAPDEYEEVIGRLREALSGRIAG
jgi:diadenosine tetraphosphate (Ap4A) HIT family hydrolase